LRRRQLGTANLLLRQDHLEEENKRLRALLDMRERQPVEGRIAEILYAARDPFSRRVIIDKGSQHGVAAGAKPWSMTWA
jgi:rod shape-determining protein MreC